MVPEILAAAAAAATPLNSAPPTVVSPLTVTAAPPGAPPSVAATVNVVGSDDTAIGQFASVWPADALASRISGHVVLSCNVDVHGLAEWCRVASETPRGKGFGVAALELRPTFKLKPFIGPDGPREAEMSIAIEFRAPDPHFDFEGSPPQGPVGDCGGGLSKPCPVMRATGNPLPRRSVTMVDHPIWTQAATFEDLARAYPARAGGVEGYAVAHCAVERSGALAGCQITKESPQKRGFGEAAMTLARKFRLAPQLAKAPDRSELWVDIPIRFPAPAEAMQRMVAAPTWVASFDPRQAPKLFPPEAAARGLTTGRGVARCVVASDGALTACAPEAADPDGLGFSEVAVKLASTMKMNLWTSDAQPVDGAVFRVAIRLDLKPSR